MGKQAKLKRSRREQRQQLRKDLTARLPAAKQAAAALTGQSDDATRACHQRDQHTQTAALYDAGWRRLDAGGDGLGQWHHRRRQLTLIHSISRENDSHIWAHVSIARYDDTLPGWYDLRDTGWLLYPDRAGLIVIAPRTQHVNVSNMLHAWYQLDGDPIPDFTAGTGLI